MAAFVFFASLGTALATPDTSWQGVVLADNLKVYIDPSSGSRMVTILTPGVHVTILVEIEALGVEWCRVQLPSETEPLGYVNCSGVQRPTSQAAKAVQKKPVSITTPSPAVSVPISLERRPEQPAAPPAGASITSIAPAGTSSTGALTNSDIVGMTTAGASC